ncbi:hypothetical protein P353_07160 [Comamonas testosteroni]|uniref:Uncharacterized protein n=1 Tax=Comamonas testosteroni TaxID=285 RepID=A0A096HQ63_COMTE|nr:hypothetical protein P353_07160 [Comamonas testosteroni]
MNNPVFRLGSVVFSQPEWNHQREHMRVLCPVMKVVFGGEQDMGRLGEGQRRAEECRDGIDPAVAE